MIADSLKKAVLQAAIQGKLTQQLPEDGNALDLFEEIKAEKEKLIKEGKIKKEKPLPEITEDEIPFDIPENWCWVRLGGITFNRGHKTPNKVFTYIDISSIDNKINQLGDLSNILTPENAPSRARKIVNVGDVIYATVRPYLHNICVIDRIIDPEPIVSTGFAVVSSTDVIINKFLFWCFLTPMFDDYANDLENAKGVAYPAINNIKFLNAIIPLPPLTEQQRIVEKLEKILPEIDCLSVDEKQLNTLLQSFPTRMKSSILQAAIQGRLTEQLPEDGDALDLLEEIRTEKERLIKEGKIKKEKPLPEITEDEIPFDIPENWCWVRLGELISIISGTSFSKNDVTSSGIRVLRGGNIDDKTNQILILGDDLFIPSRFKNTEKEILKEDIVIVGSTGSSTVIGKPAIASENMPNVQIGAFLRIVRPINNEYSNFLHLIFKSNFYRQHISSKVQGTNIYNIRSNYITEMLIPLPPLAEQQRIVQRLEELLPLCDALE